MVARRDPQTLTGRPCAVAASVQLIGDRWSMLAIRETIPGNHQFSQIARNTGAPPRPAVGAAARDLAEVGVLEQRPVSEDARHKGYYLTEVGEDLRHVVRALLAWGDKWDVTAPPMRLTHHDHPLQLESHCSTCGEKVEDAELAEEMLVPGWAMRGRQDLVAEA